MTLKSDKKGDPTSGEPSEPGENSRRSETPGAANPETFKIWPFSLEKCVRLEEESETRKD